MAIGKRLLHFRRSQSTRQCKLLLELFLQWPQAHQSFVADRPLAEFGLCECPRPIHGGRQDVRRPIVPFPPAAILWLVDLSFSVRDLQHACPLPAPMTFGDFAGLASSCPTRRTDRCLSA